MKLSVLGHVPVANMTAKLHAGRVEEDNEVKRQFNGPDWGQTYDSLL